jgi:hypothetical protein
MSDITWSDPPTIRWGKEAVDDSAYDEFYATLMNHPGRWAEWPANGEGPLKHLNSKRQKQGFRMARRKQPDGTIKVWVRFAPR